MVVDHWEGEDVIMTFEPEGLDTATNFEGKITNYRRSGGEASTEDRYAFGGKTFNFQKPQEKFTIEFDYVTANTNFAHMHFGNANATSGNNVIRSDGVKKRWRVSLWFLSPANQNKSGSVVVPDKSGELMRIVHIDAKAVTNDVDFAADDMLTGTIRFELAATDSDGYPNIIEQYHTNMASIDAFNTTAYRGTLTYNSTTPAWTSSYRT